MAKVLQKIWIFLIIMSLSAGFVLAADIELTSPVGGDFLNETLIPVTWDHIDTCGAGTDAVIVEFNNASGASGSWFILSASASASDESFIWDTTGYPDLDSYQVRLSSTCNVPDEISSDFTLDKTAPIAALDNETINEGDPVTFDASSSADFDDLSPLVEFLWDIDDDGTFDEDTNSTDTLTLTWSELESYGIDDNGFYNITVLVYDAAGNSNSITSILEVENVAPTVTIIFPNGGEELTENVVLNWTVSDPVDNPLDCFLYYEDVFAGTGLVNIVNVSCALGSNMYTWNTLSETLNATPLDSDDVEFTVFAFDGDDTGNDTSDADFLVDNSDPTASAGANQAALEGDLVSFNFSSDDGLAPAGSWFDDEVDSYFINFGDGDTLTTDSLAGINHVYDDNGLYTITLVVSDDVGHEDNDTMTVNISNVAPVVVAGPNQTTDEGISISLASTFTDAGADDNHNATIDWDDGNITFLSSTTSPITTAHTYTEDGTYTVTVTVTDDDGASDSNTLTVTVNNVAPVVEITSPVEDDFLAGVVGITGTLFDQGIVDDVSFDTLVSDDGGASWTSISILLALAPVNGSTYVAWNTTLFADGNYWIMMNATDDDGGNSFDIVEDLIVDNTAPQTIAPEISLDLFRSGAFVWFSATSIDENPLMAAHLVVVDEFDSPMLNFSISADDGAFDENAEDLEHLVAISLPDGVYSYFMVTQDASGNWEVQDPDNTDSFIVDATALEPSYTNDDIDDFINDLNDSINDNSDAITALEANVTDLQDQIDDNVVSIADLQDQIDDLNDSVTDNTDAISDLGTRIDDLETNVTNLQSQIDDLESDLATLESSVDDNSDDIDILEALVSSLEGNVTALDFRLTSLESTVTSLATNLTSLTSLVSTLETNLVSVNASLTTTIASLATLEAKVDAFLAFTITETTTNTQTTDSFDVTVTTSTNATCTISDALDSGTTVTTTAGTTHTLSVTNGELGLNLYDVVCTSSAYAFSKDTIIAVNMVGFYGINIPGSNAGFTEMYPNFFLSMNQLTNAGLSSFSVGNVLNASAGPSSQQLTTIDVEMVWGYNGTHWASHNVSAGTGDFTTFNWTQAPAYYELELESSAAGKAIMH
jgi:PKD repeat protein